MQYNGAALHKQLIAQEQQGYNDAKVLLDNNWSIRKLTRFYLLLDANMTTLKELRYRTGFQRLVNENT